MPPDTASYAPSAADSETSCAHLSAMDNPGGGAVRNPSSASMEDEDVAAAGVCGGRAASPGSRRLDHLRRPRSSDSGFMSGGAAAEHPWTCARSMIDSPEPGPSRCEERCFQVRASLCSFHCERVCECC